MLFLVAKNLTWKTQTQNLRKSVFFSNFMFKKDAENFCLVHGMYNPTFFTWTFKHSFQQKKTWKTKALGSIINKSYFSLTFYKCENSGLQLSYQQSGPNFNNNFGIRGPNFTNLCVQFCQELWSQSTLAIAWYLTR